MAVAKEQIRQIISQNNISSVADVYSLLKESLKDILRNLWRRNWMLRSDMKKPQGGFEETDYPAKNQFLNSLFK